MIGAGARANRMRARPRRTEKADGEVVRRVSVRVAEPPHLCRVQAATRELCRSIGLDEGDVFSAIIAVTELAHRLFIEGERAGGVTVAIVRRENGLGLEARAESADPGARARVSLSFRRGAGPLHA